MLFKTEKPIYRLTVSAVLIALSTVLSMIKIIKMPMGGSVTLFSMLPVCMIGLMFGTKWGLFSGFVYGLLQLVQGLDNLSYATWWGAAVTIVLFDYLLAFMSLGLTDIFHRIIKNKNAACAAGVALACFLRFLCHFITGVTVWRELTGFHAVWYSVCYNGAYMLPELVITAAGALLLFRSGAVKRIIGGSD